MARISDETVKDIRFKFDVIRQIFDSALKEGEIPSVLDSTLKYTDVDLRPEKYYFFRFLDKFVEIEKVFKRHSYRIHVNGFIPEFNGLTFNFSKDCHHELIDNYFGESENFSDCLYYFREIVRQIFHSEDADGLF